MVGRTCLSAALAGRAHQVRRCVTSPSYVKENMIVAKFEEPEGLSDLVGWLNADRNKLPSAAYKAFQALCEALRPYNLSKDLVRAEADVVRLKKALAEYDVSGA